MEPDGWLRPLRYEMRRIDFAGDRIICLAKIVQSAILDGLCCGESEVWIECQREGVSAPGEATVTLPWREPTERSVLRWPYANR